MTREALRQKLTSLTPEQFAGFGIAQGLVYIRTNGHEAYIFDASGDLMGSAESPEDAVEACYQNNMRVSTVH